MRVVSLVPSWTETLLEAGVEVVGRTRYCIHGRGVNDIARIGGTKDWDFDKIQALRPDLLILDREENPKFMAEQGRVPHHATHVTSIKDMPKALRDLSGILGNSELEVMAQRYEALPTKVVVKDLPAILDRTNDDGRHYINVVYVIWKDPWMAAGQGTFIASVLEYCGKVLAPVEGKYPEINFSQFDPKITLLVFSSEPYPFLKKKERLGQLGFANVTVDGEKFSWFGVRNLRFLERLNEE